MKKAIIFSADLLHSVAITYERVSYGSGYICLYLGSELVAYITSATLVALNEDLLETVQSTN
jgi:hypothetical protein